jgi:hypothetical protein
MGAKETIIGRMERKGLQLYLMRMEEGRRPYMYVYM